MKNSNATSNAHNKSRRNFVQMSALGLLVGFGGFDSKTVGQEIARSDSERNKRIYNDVQAFASKVNSNKRELQEFNKKLKTFENGLASGRSVESLATELINSNENLRRIREKYTEGDEPKGFIIIIIIIVILLLIPKKAY